MDSETTAFYSKITATNTILLMRGNNNRFFLNTPVATITQLLAIFWQSECTSSRLMYVYFIKVNVLHQCQHLERETQVTKPIFSTLNRHLISIASSLNGLYCSIEHLSFMIEDAMLTQSYVHIKSE